MCVTGISVLAEYIDVNLRSKTAFMMSASVQSWQHGKIWQCESKSLIPFFAPPKLLIVRLGWIRTAIAKIRRGCCHDERPGCWRLSSERCVSAKHKFGAAREPVGMKSASAQTHVTANNGSASGTSRELLPITVQPPVRSGTYHADCHVPWHVNGTDSWGMSTFRQNE